MPSGLSAVWTEAQRSLATHKKCAKALSAQRAKLGEAAFREELLKCVNCALLVYKREPAVERLVQFLVALTTAAACGDGEGEPSEAEGDDMLTFMLEHLVAHHECKDKAVRFRATQMVAQIMNAMPEDAELSDELFDAIQSAMVSRCSDKVPLVRLHAANALHRLQVPTERDDVVTAELLRLMGSDSSAEVRRVALGCIGLSRHTLPHILRRARDTKPEVRVHAYSVIGAKLDPKWLTIAQRVALLRDGLRDRDEGVRAACSEMLRTHWLRKSGNDALKLLGALDVEGAAPEAELAAARLLEGAHTPAWLGGGEVWAGAAGGRGLSVEQALLLRVRYTALAAGSARDKAALEACAPDVPAYAAAVRAAHAAGAPCVVRELLPIARVLDWSDEAGRRQLGALARELLGSHELAASADAAPILASALELLRGTHESETSFVRAATELISELADPLGADEAAEGAEAAEEGEGGGEEAGEGEETAEEAHARQLDALLGRVGELKSQLASCAALGDADAAAMLTRDLAELEAQVAAHEASAPEAARRVGGGAEAISNTICALRLTAALLKATTADMRAAELHGLLAALILPALQNAADAVRELAACCLGLACALGAHVAARFWRLLVQVAARDTTTVKAAALRALSDVLCAYTPAQLAPPPPPGAPPPSAAEQGAAGEAIVAECVAVLCRVAVRDGGAREPAAQAAAAQALCKLLLLERVPPAQRVRAVCTALCALFADGGGGGAHGAPPADEVVSPADEAEEACLGEMRQFVQRFFESFQAERQRQLLAHALVVSARAACAAPRRTAWAGVCVDQLAPYVASFAGEALHAQLALEIARELYLEPEGAHVPPLAKALGALGYSAENVPEAQAEELRALLAVATGPDTLLERSALKLASKWAGANGLGQAECADGADADELDAELKPAVHAVGAAREAELAELLALCSSSARSAVPPSADKNGSAAKRASTRAPRRLASTQSMRMAIAT